jgi:hypothetical protein
MKPNCKECESILRDERISRDDGSLRKRFLMKVEKSKSGCWLWQGGKSPKGYGEFSVMGFSMRANRVAYRMFIGPIADGLWVLHSCDTPACCNPDHLRLGTHDDNVADKVSRRRQSRPVGTLHPMHKLDEGHVAEIRRSRLGGAVLAKKYGVSQATICDIRSRRSWKHVA